MNWGNKQATINHYCCWCRKDIPENILEYELTAKPRKDVEAPIAENEGYVIDIYVHESMDLIDYKPVWTIITAKNSDAKKAGYGMIFMLCSEECGHELRKYYRQL